MYLEKKSVRMNDGFPHNPTSISCSQIPGEIIEVFHICACVAGQFPPVMVAVQ